MSDKYKQIEAFIKVAETRNFTRAGDLLNLSQPALSLLISQFEKQLGLKLFDRTTRSVELTKAGEEFLPDAIRIVQDVTSSIDALKLTARVMRGKLHIVSLPSTSSSLLVGHISRFKKSHPKISIKIEELAAGKIIDAIVAGTCDFGIGILDEERESLRFQPYFKDRLVLLCPQSSPLAAKPFVRWTDLKSEPMVFMNETTSVRNLINAACVQNSMKLSRAFEVNFMTTAISFVRAELGVTILPTTALQDFSLTGISVVEIAEPVVERSIGLLQRSDRLLSPAAMEFTKGLINMKHEVLASAGLTSNMSIEV